MRKRKSFKHLSEHDRDRINALYLHGHEQKKIAEVLGVDPGTISRELNRYKRTTWRYSAQRAQRDAEEKRLHSKCPGMKLESFSDLKKYIIEELRNLRSPDEIAGRLRREKVVPRVGKNAIYKWLYSEYGKEYCKYLCTKRSRPKAQSKLSKRTLIPNTDWTMDNGIENIYHEQFGLPTFFCTPGSPWQKPHVENSIGLTRRWFLPKGTDLSKVPDGTFQSMLFVLNHKYRKSLGYKSAYEVACDCGIIKKIPSLSKSKAIAFH